MRKKSAVYGSVLILVLLEYTLGEAFPRRGEVDERLNPCFVGIYSRRGFRREVRGKGKQSLNPCFVGIYSRS